MLSAIVRASLAHPRIVTALSVLIAVLSFGALLHARFDVFPDFAPPHVTVQTEAPGLDAQQVESLVTRPLEGLLAGTEGVKTVRSKSIQGLSAIYVVFRRRGNPYRQRQVVTERLAAAAAILPAGTGPPLLSPLSSSMQYLEHFGFTSDSLTPMQLRGVVRWQIEPQILSVPGVSQAMLYGGAERERQVLVDPQKLAADGLTLDDVIRATRRSTELIGGGYIQTPVQRIVVRAQAPAATSRSLAQAELGTRAGLPIRLGDVADVRDGAAPRFGDAIIGDQPGILVETSTQYGANTLTVTRALEKRLNQLAPALRKEGVIYHPALLRPATFVTSALTSLRGSLLIGAALVVILLLATLRDWRGALISFSSIPLSLLATVWILEMFGISLNTMTIGGLVVALGVVVDDAVIDVENITRRRRDAGAAGEALDAPQLFIGASLEVRQPVFYATAAVVMAFLPIIMLTGIQGAFFRPLSAAFLLAVGISLLVAMSATPALCALLMRKNTPPPEARFLVICKRLQQRAIQRLYGSPRLVLAVLLGSGVAGAALLPLFGQRLLPNFRENYLIAHARLRAGISLRETSRVGEQISRRLLAIEGVKTVAEQIGRAVNGQDRDAPNKSEFDIQIDPAKGRTPGQIEAAIHRVFVDFPNQLTEVYSVLAERIGETLSGESAPFFVSVFGNDLDADDAVAARIAAVLRTLPDAGAVRLQVPPRQPELHVRLRPERLALYGLQPSQVLRAVNAAYQGAVVGQLAEADRSIPVVVRIAGAGASPQAVAALPLRSANGAVVPLSAVAKVVLEPGRSEIDHEDGLRRQVVTADATTTDQTGFAAAAQRAIGRQVKVPPGVYLRFGGTAQAQLAAAHQLYLHAAAALVLIVLLLGLAFGRGRHVALVLLVLPSTLIGGVAAAAITGATLTLGAMVGFVALFGMAARNTILLVSHYDHLVRVEGQSWGLETALRGSRERLTPVLLTALLTALALLPVAVQLHQPGHEIEGPMAVVILGGLVSSTLVSLVLVPPLAARWLQPEGAPSAGEEAPGH
jgi:CzcA family heavy metal efflux pump